MNKLEIVTDERGVIQAVRVNGAEIRPLALRFEADAEHGDLYTVHLKFAVDAVFTDPSVGSAAKEEAVERAPMPRWLGDDERAT